jgi:hypothetical protein
LSRKKITNSRPAKKAIKSVVEPEIEVAVDVDVEPEIEVAVEPVIFLKKRRTNAQVASDQRLAQASRKRAVIKKQKNIEIRTQKDTELIKKVLKESAKPNEPTENIKKPKLRRSRPMPSPTNTDTESDDSGREGRYTFV